ncbi:uncharacterized protein GIQ15_02016 [Arthroderma uncinatum]|uniref:uncharacterized protein n=1 Tax=Arthroderma uncinatum TaxID=74035 RepID=UPI00144A590A|nr:uncharacterized protein GIQ15_02016 [Arthroderma uncinatum]KAF3482692.1 hypothetical protein GIQ15_02016 [Arthroderma uncinatum]
MPEFTPLNKMETEPMDVKMEDINDVPAEGDKITPTTNSSDAAAEFKDTTSESDEAEAKDTNKESEVEEEPATTIPSGKAANGKATNGKAANGKATNGKAANGKAANGKKGAANGKKANDASTEEENGAAVKNEEADIDNPQPPQTPVTPHKRGRKPKAATGAGGAITAEEADDEAETPSKKKRGTPGKATPSKGTPSKAGKRPLPNSLEEASEEDKMLLRMKDEENKPWGEIKAAWEAATGEPIGGSTLSGRYQRIKANFTVFTNDDATALVQFKKDIEEKFETEKWMRIADAIENSGGKRYPAAALMKKFKEMGKKTADTNGTNDEVKDEDGE